MSIGRVKLSDMMGMMGMIHQLIPYVLYSIQITTKHMWTIMG